MKMHNNGTERVLNSIRCLSSPGLEISADTPISAAYAWCFQEQAGQSCDSMLTKRGDEVKRDKVYGVCGSAFAAFGACICSSQRIYL